MTHNARSQTATMTRGAIQRPRGHIGMAGRAHAGQGVVEFALSIVVILGLLLGTMDLARAGFAQHSLDGGASALVQSVAAITNTNSSGSLSTYAPTALYPLTTTVSLALATAMAQAARTANGAFSATSPLTSTGAMTLTNGMVTIIGSPSLARPDEITVTITSPFTPVAGLFLGGKSLHLSAHAAAITIAGQGGT